MATEYLAQRYRGDFPILDQKVNGFPLVYLDNAASTQHPTCVIDEIARYYREDHANVHRGIHALSSRATKLYEDARACAARVFRRCFQRIDRLHPRNNRRNQSCREFLG